MKISKSINKFKFLFKISKINIRKIIAANKINIPYQYISQINIINKLFKQLKFLVTYKYVNKYMWFVD